jgi:hypothetical protein
VQTAAQRVFNRIDAPFCESWREKIIQQYARDLQIDVYQIRWLMLTVVWT